jgi:hypothetical protein
LKNPQTSGRHACREISSAAREIRGGILLWSFRVVAISRTSITNEAMPKPATLMLPAFSLLIVAFCAPTAMAAAGQCTLDPLPKGTLKVGMPYHTVRQRILAAGYAPYPPKKDRKEYCSDKTGTGYKYVCATWPEISDCSIDGYCAAFFRDSAGNRLKLVITGSSDRISTDTLDGTAKSCAGHGDSWFP